MIGYISVDIIYWFDAITVYIFYTRQNNNLNYFHQLFIVFHTISFNIRNIQWQIAIIQFIFEYHAELHESFSLIISRKPFSYNSLQIMYYESSRISSIEHWKVNATLGIIAWILYDHSLFYMLACVFEMDGVCRSQISMRARFLEMPW